MRIRVTCSPDADDLFMMRALVDGSIDTGDYEFVVDHAPTDALNRIASGADGPEVIALSMAHLPAVHDRYQLLPHGGSMGEGYGPMLIVKRGRALPDLSDFGAIRAWLEHQRIAIPGKMTSAFLALLAQQVSGRRMLVVAAAAEVWGVPAGSSCTTNSRRSTAG